MSDNRRQQEFYHGSTADFKPGDVIKSPAARGVPNPRPDNPDYLHDRVYVTPHHLITARIYAWKPGDNPQEGPSGHIYKVKPVGQKRVDKEALRRHRIPGISYHFREAVVISKHNPNTMEEIKD
jgi:hypothetical protein